MPELLEPGAAPDLVPGYSVEDGGAGFLSTFAISPTSQAGPRGLGLTFAVTLQDSNLMPIGAPAGGQPFVLSDGGQGGTFVPTELTIAAGVSVGLFQYAQPRAGTFILGIAPDGGPLAASAPQYATATIGAGPMPTAAINPPGKIFGEGYFYGSNGSADDTPFGTFQDLTFNTDATFKELMGPEQLTALAVGQSDTKVTLDLSYATFAIEQLLLARGGTLTTVAPVLAPTVAPVPTAASGSTNYTAGFIAVAHAWMTPYGDTAISPIATVSVTAGQQISIASLAAAMGTAGGTGVDYFMSGASYATGALASAAPLLWAMSSAGAVTVLPNSYPGSGARPAPTQSAVSAARRVVTASVADQEIACRLHFKTPVSGGDLEMFFFNCLIPKLSIPLKLHEFTIPKITVNVYGDTTQPGAPIYQTLTS